MINIIDSYANGAVTSGIGDADMYVGQSFTNTTECILDSATFKIRKGLLTSNGTAYYKVYAHTGTYGTNSTPTGSALATSAGTSVNGLTQVATLINLKFNGANRIKLSANTKYCIVLTIENRTTGTLVYIYDGTTKTHAGNYFYSSNGSSWTPSSEDMPFYVYGVDGASNFFQFI